MKAVHFQFERIYFAILVSHSVLFQLSVNCQSESFSFQVLLLRKKNNINLTSFMLSIKKKKFKKAKKSFYR